MYVTNVDDVEEYEMTEEGANGVKVKHLLHEGIGAKRLHLRLFTIEVGGYTPLEKHRHEHEVFILKGKALVRGADREVRTEEGAVIFISSWEEHQFKNLGDERLLFLCTKEKVGENRRSA